jgi:NADPH2:quinone reductase
MSEQPTMLAAVYEREGAAADVLEVREVARPDPGPGQVRVRVDVSAVNPTDVKIRSGGTPRPIDGFQIPHMDGAGVVDAVGSGVDPARVGQRVWLLLAAHGSRHGTAAQWTVVPESRAVPVPEGADLDVAATLGVPAVTAAHCLFADGSIAGRDVLVAGGAGAVGRAAVQLARWAGARVVATVSGPEKADVARAAGAHHVVNYRDADAADLVRAATPSPYRIVEVALAANLDLDLDVSSPGTTIVAYAVDGPDPTLPVRRCMTAGVTLTFVLLYTVPQPELDEAVALVSAALRDGALDAPPTRRFPLAEIAAAHQAQDGGVTGKILLDIP